MTTFKGPTDRPETKEFNIRLDTLDLQQQIYD